MSDTPDDDRPGPAPLDEVIDPTEHPAPDHREHAKADPRPDDEELRRRTEHERRLISDS